MVTSGREFFLWTDAYGLNIGILDRQHQNLVSLVNELHQAITKRLGREILGQIFSLLVKYANVHFELEEMLMQLHGYPDYPAHKAEHDWLTAALADFQHKFRQKEIGLTIEEMTFLKSWGVKHLLEFDKKYAPYLNRKGVF